MAKQKKLSEVVQPLIRSNEEKNILEEIFDGDPADLPEIKSVGYMRIGSGQNSWISYVITTRGREVIAIEVDEPNMRAMAEESAKIAFVSNFIDQEAF